MQTAQSFRVQKPLIQNTQVDLSLLKSLEVLISDFNIPTFVVCAESDKILIVNKAVSESYKMQPPVNRYFNQLFYQDKSRQKESLVYFCGRWYKKSRKEFEINGRHFAKIALIQCSESIDEGVMNSVRDTISMILHRFRSPLTGMMGYLDLLKSIGLTGKHVQYADQVQSGLENLTDMLKEFESLLETDKISPRSLFSPLDMVREILSDIPDANERIKLISEENGMIFSCKNTLQHIVKKLIDNALLFAPNEPNAISVAIQSPQSIQVTNRVAVPTHDSVQKYFRPFISERSDRLGIGLTLAQLLSEKIGATIRISTFNKDKITFSLLLPPKIIPPNSG